MPSWRVDGDILGEKDVVRVVVCWGGCLVVQDCFLWEVGDGRPVSMYRAPKSKLPVRLYRSVKNPLYF